MLIIAYALVITNEETGIHIAFRKYYIKGMFLPQAEKSDGHFSGKSGKRRSQREKTEIQEGKRGNQEGKSGRSPGNLPLSIGY